MKNKKHTIDTLTSDDGSLARDTAIQNKHLNLETDPDWIKLQKDSMKLGNENQELSNQERIRDIHRQEISIIDMRIENARRNVDLLSKLCIQNYLHGEMGIKGMETFIKEAIEALLLNIKILKETEKIK
jgi:hypothetical protein